MRRLFTAGISVAALAGAGAFVFVYPNTTSAPEFIRTDVPKPSRIAVLFGGDMMFDRAIRVTSDEKGQDYLLACMRDFLVQKDLVVTNLEGPITRYQSQSVGSKPGSPDNFIFTFPTTTAALLVRHNIRVVSLGNNHIRNFGLDGERETKEHLTSAGVRYFGDTEEDAIAYMHQGNVPLAFIAYNQFGGAGSVQTIAHIKKAKADGYVPVIFAHWGDEYVPANDLQKRLAHDFIDAGAEIVIGAHPHVIQEHEIYAGKHIYYSLGNMVFDQYFTEDVRKGLMVRVTFGEHGVEDTEEIPIYLERDRRTCLVE